MYHRPVLLFESVDLLNVQPSGTYIDVTFGGGGHSREILRRLGAKGRLFAFDRDADARQNLINDPRFSLIPADFKQIARELHKRNLVEVDGILGDLGVSSHQFDTAERGFSFRFDADLDMRMDVEQELTAADVLNTYSDKDLQHVFSQFGEIPNSKTLAQHVVNERHTQQFKTIKDFLTRVERCVRGKDKSKYLAQLFQALRIEVNGELESLDALLTDGLEALKKEGRMVIISYHSLEDRRVKQFFKTGNLDGKLQKDFYGNIHTPWELLTKKSIVPTANEIQENPRARSAKLRAAAKN